MNAPGCWEDEWAVGFGISMDVVDIYDRLGARVVVGSEYEMLEGDEESDDEYDGNEWMVRCSQEGSGPVDSNVKDMNQAVASIRELSAHGIRMIRAQFPRLMDTIGSEDEFKERRLVLALMVSLYNYQTSTIGVKENLNVFMSKTSGLETYAFCGGRLEQIEETANNVFKSNSNN